MPEETTILEEPGIKITNLRAVFENKTYPIANITSVGVEKQTPTGCLPGIGFIIGLMMVMYGFTNLRENLGTLVLGLLFAIPTGYLLAAPKPSYVLQLSTAAGEVKALISPDQAHIQKISEALNTAIIQKG